MPVARTELFIPSLVLTSVLAYYGTMKKHLSPTALKTQTVIMGFIGLLSIFYNKMLRKERAYSNGWVQTGVTVLPVATFFIGSYYQKIPLKTTLVTTFLWGLVHGGMEKFYWHQNFQKETLSQSEKDSLLKLIVSAVEYLRNIDPNEMSKRLTSKKGETIVEGEGLYRFLIDDPDFQYEETMYDLGVEGLFPVFWLSTDPNQTHAITIPKIFCERYAKEITILKEKKAISPESIRLANNDIYNWFELSLEPNYKNLNFQGFLRELLILCLMDYSSKTEDLTELG